jgi:predicted transcriptional regulator
VLSALARPGVAPEMFAYCAAEFSRRPGVADVLAKNSTCPIEVLRPVIHHLSVTGVQQLFEDLDRLSTSPVLVAELVASTVINAEQRNLLMELQRAEPEPIQAFAEIAEAAEPDKAKRQTLMQKLGHMRVVERVQRALKGGRDERLLLIRDPCKVVQRAVLQSPQLSEQEVESFSSMATLTDETLRLIANNQKYRKNYTILRALEFNPKTPIEVTLHLLPLMKPPDLKFLTGNKNISETLRTAATRLQRQRAVQRGS